MLTFEQMQTVANQLKETKDCAVKAVAAATDTPYVVVRKMMQREGRRPSKPTRFDIIYKTIDMLGCKRNNVTNQYYAKTIRTLEREMKDVKGSYMVYTRGHVLAIVDGEVLDWTKGRCHRIIKIEKIEEK
jgi:hypothetical protein